MASTLYAYLRAEEKLLDEKSLDGLQRNMKDKAGSKHLALWYENGFLYAKIENNTSVRHLDALRMLEELGYEYVESQIL